MSTTPPAHNAAARVRKWTRLSGNVPGALRTVTVPRVSRRGSRRLPSVIPALLLLMMPGATGDLRAQTVVADGVTRTTLVGNGPNTAGGATLALGTNARITVGNLNAVSLGDGAVITLAQNASITNNATSGTGLWSTGNNTVEFGSNGRLTVAVGASIMALGTQNNGESVNVMGVGNVITNYGTLSSRNGAAIWFEDRVTGGVNTIDNYGIIRTQLGASANVIGNQRDGAVRFINRTGGRIEGSLSFASGNDQLTLEAGSVITGSFDGGGGTNSLTLGGAVGSSDNLGGNIRNFQSLIKDGEGIWTLTGSVGANGGGVPLQVEVRQGTLALTGNNASFNGSVLVNPAGILEARAQSLPPTVTDNGLVRFVQDTAGTFSGLVQGTGRVEKTLGGELVFAGANTYSGGTTILAGAIRISSDANLGAASGGLILDGGTLRTATDLATARATTLGAGGGVFDALSGTLTHTGVIGGSGLLAKQGAGTLVLSGANTWTGGTAINGGTVQVAGNGNLGAAGGGLSFNSGTLRTTASFTTARAATLGAGGGTLNTDAGTTLGWGGVISGEGTLTKTGAGTLVLTASNAHTGGTAINGGVVEIASNANLGAAGGALSFNSGTLRTTGGMTINRATTLNAGGGILEVGGNPDQAPAFVRHTGVIGGTGGLTKTGSGTLILSGANTWTGATTVSGGYLYVNGDQSLATGATTVTGAGTRLAGSGIIGGDVVLADGATIGPGFEPFTAATLTINGNLSLGGDTTLLYNLVEASVAGGSLNDLIVVNGDLSLNGATLNILD
ncbi:autotransporter-associated beta strand repeat protein [Opitutaceae bacterium TAV1]|nr:autotransporter-associated beta strand repeat protein [Opitutaceae bacterium TAV1]